MKDWFLHVGGVLTGVATSAAATNLIEPGDSLFVQARVLGCAESMRTVEMATVAEAGTATFFGDIVVPAVGKTSGEVASELADALAPRQGRRPESIFIIRVAAGDDRAIAIFGMSLLDFRTHGCKGKLPPSEAPMWRYDWRIADVLPGGKQAVSG